LAPIYFFFIILVILEIILLVLIYLIFLFSRRIKKETGRVMDVGNHHHVKIFKKTDLDGLPVPVKKYLSFSLPEGQKYINKAKITQSGWFRTEDGKKWLPIKSIQYFNCTRPSFAWVANLKIRPMIWITARDLYYDQKGGLLVKLFSSITLSESSGKEIDISSLTRYLAEMVWFPTSLIPSKYLSWTPIDDSSSQAELKDGKNKARAIFKFDMEGKIKEIYSDERYRRRKGKYYRESWRGFLKNYIRINGMNIPSKIEAEWTSKKGTFKYIKLALDKVEYD